MIFKGEGGKEEKKRRKKGTRIILLWHKYDIIKLRCLSLFFFFFGTNYRVCKTVYNHTCSSMSGAGHLKPALFVHQALLLVIQKYRCLSINSHILLVYISYRYVPLYGNGNPTFFNKHSPSKNQSLWN